MPLRQWELASGGTATCISCGSRNTPHVYPAAFAQSNAAGAEAALEGEAACFDHPSSRAVGACQQCGRFVCQLCAVKIAGGVLCPSCVALGPTRAGAASIEARTLYDTWALVIPLALWAIWPLTILAAPAVVALAIMKWRAPISLVRRNRWRFALGLGLGVAEGIGWVWFLVYVVAKIRSSG